MYVHIYDIVSISHRRSCHCLSLRCHLLKQRVFLLMQVLEQANVAMKAFRAAVPGTDKDDTDELLENLLDHHLAILRDKLPAIRHESCGSLLPSR